MATTEAATARPVAARFRWPSGLASMGYRDYRLLWAGTALAQTGQWAQQVATGWLILDITGSGFYLGLAGFLRSIDPHARTGTGWRADRRRRRGDLLLLAGDRVDPFVLDVDRHAAAPARRGGRPW